ncbi:MAG: response regulator [Planctomycetes bacterium]|nr:response regulator [Planctomycetota bacterium]
MLEVMPMEARSKTHRARRHVVVVVDDDPRVLAALQRLLQREPYEIVALETPGEVLECVEERQVSLIIADQRMPEMTGTDLLRAVGDLSPETARIMLTGYPECVPLEGEAYQRLFVKPWDGEQLKRTIRHLLREVDRQASYIPE